MADPLSKLNKMVRKQKLIVEIQRQNAAKIQAEKGVTRQAEKVQPTPTIEQPPTGSPAGDV